MLTRDPKPQLVQNLNGKITQVTCGSETTFVITNSDLLYGWGLGVAESSQSKPILIDVHMPQQLAAGSSHQYALTKHGLVMGWGEGTSGRLGNNSDSEITEPQVIESFQEATDLNMLQVRQVSCGENHSLAIVEMLDDYRKLVFVWGSNDKRQLGIDEDFDEVKVPH